MGRGGVLFKRAVVMTLLACGSVQQGGEVACGMQSAARCAQCRCRAQRDSHSELSSMEFSCLYLLLILNHHCPGDCAATMCSRHGVQVLTCRHALTQAAASSSAQQLCDSLRPSSPTQPAQVYAPAAIMSR